MEKKVSFDFDIQVSLLVGGICYLLQNVLIPHDLSFPKCLKCLVQNPTGSDQGVPSTRVQWIMGTLRVNAKDAGLSHDPLRGTKRSRLRIR